jgi:hypothetical protein
MLFASFALLVAVSSHHHLPCRRDITPSSSPTKTQDKADSPLHPRVADVDGADKDDIDNNNADDNADDDAHINADNADKG